MKKFEYTINGKKYSVEINTIEGNVADVEVNGKSYKVELPEKEEAPTTKITPVVKPAAPKPAAPQAAATAAPQQQAPAATGGSPILSPLPGVILDVCCNVGDEVKKGQKVIVLEAMKMENDIKADRDGKVLSIGVAKGDSIQEGTTLVTIG